ncbi:malectin domain-containing carbohydrate-binding protein [Maribacter sp. 2307UL18-2]|uniref:malectin domain-containing carbohydrate-binding protein n=1 Tax=Maribacter sp. 2307UL18-2 TaxID=3386274 RepID=UPI0039BD09F9
MKDFPLSRFMLITISLSLSLIPIACGSDDGDDPEPVVVVEVPEADPTNANTTIEATPTAVANGTDASAITVTLADTKGNRFTTSGGAVVLSTTGLANISAVTDNSDGTYSATITNTAVETITLSGTLSGTAMTDTAEVTFEPELIGSSILKINCGGPEVTIGDETFLEDQFFFGPSNSFKNEDLTEIEGTNLDEIFYTERITKIESPNDPFSYNIPVSNGTYTVVLHFAEIFWGIAPEGINGGTGSRVFNVEIEGTTVFENIDLFEELGAARATGKFLDVEVMDGELTIVLQSSVDRPKISAIEVFGDGVINP